MKDKLSLLTQTIINYFSAARSVSTTSEIHEQGSFTSSNREHTTDVTAASPPSSTLVSSDDVLRTEVLWMLQVLTSSYLYNSSKNISNLFSKIFPDSQIAQYFSCGATNCAYLLCFGLYPYFYELLTDRICTVKNYKVSFDVSLNQVNQKKQIDMMI